MSDSEDDEPIVELSKDQRYPEAGEPVCKICGRYGAYICDETNEDVCSIECKQKSILNHQPKQSISFRSAFIILVEEEELKTVDQENTFDKSVFYTESQAVSQLTESQVKLLREKLFIEIQGDQQIKPILNFEDCPFSETMSKNIRDAGYLSPTPIQMQAIPYILNAYNTVLISPTGTGKTASYLFPLIHLCSKLVSTQTTIESESHPLGLILAPSRELCIQIEDCIKQISLGIKNMKTCLLVGGMSLSSQIYRLKQGVTICIGTPGRILDILSSQQDPEYQKLYDHHGEPVLHFDQLCFYVQEEVDLLIKSSFLTQLESLSSHFLCPLQTILVTATLTENLKQHIKTYISNPIFIIVRDNPQNRSIQEEFYWVEERNKQQKLLSLLSELSEQWYPLVIFVSTKLVCEEVYEFLKKNLKASVQYLHNEVKQEKRIEIVNQFIHHQTDILIVTGLLGRGIDLQIIKTVIHYDFPSSLSEYIHQSGRAGRLGDQGRSIAFINNKVQKLLKGLKAYLEEKKIPVPQELNHNLSPYENETRNFYKRLNLDFDENYFRESQKRWKRFQSKNH